MGLETRKGRSYYYRKVRDGRHIHSEYVGAGHLAETMARLEQVEREEKEYARKKAKDDRAQFAELDAAIRLNDSIIKAALTELLEANGYHLHKRQWRKKRNQPPAISKHLKGCC